MDEITKLVIAAEQKADIRGREPFHVQTPEHRAICWRCMWDWWQLK